MTGINKKHRIRVTYIIIDILSAIFDIAHRKGYNVGFFLVIACNSEINIGLHSLRQSVLHILLKHLKPNFFLIGHSLLPSICFYYFNNITKPTTSTKLHKQCANIPNFNESFLYTQ